MMLELFVHGTTTTGVFHNEWGIEAKNGPVTTTVARYPTQNVFVRPQVSGGDETNPVLRGWLQRLPSPHEGPMPGRDRDIGFWTNQTSRDQRRAPNKNRLLGPVSG